MKLTSTKLLSRLLSFLIVFICSISTIQAQDFEDDVIDNPPPVASIDDWVIPMLLLGMVFMYYFYKKQMFTKVK